MKHFICLLCGVFLAGMLLGSLSACGGPGGTSSPSIDTAEPSGTAPTETEEPPNPDQQAHDARRQAFGQLLWDVYQKGVLPDSTQLDWSGTEAASRNQFALCDVNGDGLDELILYWTEASSAGMMALVYGYESGAVYQRLCEFPALTFYDNGMVQAEWSHNQGWGGRFWPYTLYRYDADNGVFLQTAGVDAWDRACTEENFPGAFPEDVDADGDGLVYFLLTGCEWYTGERIAPDGSLYTTWSVDPVDGPDYENWREIYLEGASEIEIPIQRLTEENIAALGVPKPETAVEEPAG